MRTPKNPQASHGTVTVKDRIEFVKVALKAFKLSVYGIQALDEFEEQDLIVDLLTDLKHYSNHHRMDFEKLCARADWHYAEEIDGSAD